MSLSTVSGRGAVTTLIAELHAFRDRGPDQPPGPPPKNGKSAATPEEQSLALRIAKARGRWDALTPAERVGLAAAYGPTWRDPDDPTSPVDRLCAELLAFRAAHHGRAPTAGVDTTGDAERSLANRVHHLRTQWETVSAADRARVVEAFGATWTPPGSRAVHRLIEDLVAFRAAGPDGRLRPPPKHGVSAATPEERALASRLSDARKRWHTIAPDDRTRLADAFGPTWKDPDAKRHAVAARPTPDSPTPDSPSLDDTP